MNRDIPEAKQWLPLPALLHRLGLAEHAKRSARCPFHDDKHNSFSMWRNGAGVWFFKCHAGCGEGDEITFLELHERIPNNEATKLFLEMSNANGATLREPQRRSRSARDWRASVQSFTEEHVEHVVKWRGYSHEVCS